MVREVDENPSYVSQASVTPECVYDQSVDPVAVRPALSPQHALPAECPLFALLTVSATQSSLEAESPPKRHAALQA